MARILLIEDNRDHLELMAYILRAQGHMPLSAGNAESGRTMITCCEEIDLIICDINLGSESGIDLVKALRKSGRLKHVPIVAVTAGSVGQASAAFAAGFDHYLLKPIEPETFIAKIKECLASSGKASARPAGAPVTPSDASRGRQVTILAVDDRSANLELISALLQPLGYRVITAHGVEEALARVRSEHPLLVVTDVHMGDGSGFDLIRTLQQDPGLHHIPWLVTSATYLSMDGRAADLHLDDSNFLLQPWDSETFIAKIERRLKEGHAPATAASAGQGMA